jgi:predicted nuclease of predicted toxin-antitoxin system
MSTAESDGWFEISEDLIREPGTQSKKLKLYADANVPKQLTDEIRKAGIPIQTAYEDRVNTKADQGILAWVRKSDRVLLTLDKDFWNDRKFPLQKLPGIIFIDFPPDRVDDAIAAFWVVYETLASLLGNWEQMKIKAAKNGYFMKGVSWEGKVIRYEVKVTKEHILAREIPTNMGT